MSKPVRITGLVLGCSLALLAGWRILSHGLADHHAQTDPERALSWMPSHPAAQLALIERQFAANQFDAALTSAHALLAREPLQGEAWRWIGDVERSRGQHDQARVAYAKATALSPYNSAARLELAEYALRDGDSRAALTQIDAVLTTAPPLRKTLMPGLLLLARDPVFRTVLLDHLEQRPKWREAFLQQLLRADLTDETAQIADTLLSGLQKRKTLSRLEHERWIESLIRRNEWPQAYARWSSALPPDQPLQPIFNGDFHKRPTGRGFDWRITGNAGVDVMILPEGGARLRFHGRRVRHAGLEQALLLKAGSYQLQAQMQGQALHASRGLEWVVTCAHDGRVLGRTPPFKGSNAWHTPSAQIKVPTDCPGQWLRLQNSESAEPLQSLSGMLRISQIKLNASQDPTH